MLPTRKSILIKLIRKLLLVGCLLRRKAVITLTLIFVSIGRRSFYNPRYEQDCTVLKLLIVQVYLSLAVIVSMRGSVMWSNSVDGPNWAEPNLAITSSLTGSMYRNWP